MDEIAENCTRAAIFSEGKVFNVASPKNLFADGEKLLEMGLDTPFTAKLTKALKERGVHIESDLTTRDFLSKLLLYAKTQGAGMRLNGKGGQDHA